MQVQLRLIYILLCIDVRALNVYRKQQYIPLLSNVDFLLQTWLKPLNCLSKPDTSLNMVNKHITLMGSDMDEAPMAYKYIHTVMAAQNNLVEVLARFEPRIVRMESEEEAGGLRNILLLTCLKPVY